MGVQKPLFLYVFVAPDVQKTLFFVWVFAFRRGKFFRAANIFVYFPNRKRSGGSLGSIIVIVAIAVAVAVAVVAVLVATAAVVVTVAIAVLSFTPIEKLCKIIACPCDT